tara:strand:+ start:158 stop:691 length:534 start_codon:yes stop_codon:yes gene_type:complete
MKIREGRLINARFTDPTCTMIRCEFKDYDKPEGTNISIQMHSYNPENKFVKEILAEHNEEDLERNYVEFNKMENLRQQMFQKFVERFDEIIDYLDSGVPAQQVVEAPVTLSAIKDVGNVPEDFFKLKLEIFELEEVKNSKNRQWKAAMRKATTSLELLSLLNEVYSTLENEEGERQD